MALNPPLPGEERTVSVAAFSMHRAGMRSEERRNQLCTSLSGRLGVICLSAAETQTAESPGTNLIPLKERGLPNRVYETNALTWLLL